MPPAPPAGPPPAGKKKNKKKGLPHAKQLSASSGSAKMSKAEKERLGRYDRGDGNRSKGVKKQRLRASIKRSESKVRDAARQAAQAELLLPTEPGVLEPENEMEMTARISQAEIARSVDLQTQRKAYDMKLEKLGPYRSCYTADGRHALLGGRKGHLAVLRWESHKIVSEIQASAAPRPRAPGDPSSTAARRRCGRGARRRDSRPRRCTETRWRRSAPQ